MNYRLSVVLLFLLAPVFTVKANFNFNPQCIEAYKDVFRLRMNDARAIIKEERQKDPQNGVMVLLDNYVDYLDLLLTDDKAKYDKLKDERSARLNALEKNDEKSPYYLFAQAEVYLQWGILKAKFGDYVSSFLDIRKAKNLLRENEEKYPTFLPNQKDLGLIDVILGALPSNLKGIAKFLGMSGSTTAGIQQLEKLRAGLVNTPYNYYLDEVVFSLCYININVLHTKNNYTLLMGYVKDMDGKSLLKNYLEGYIAAKNGHNDEAIEVLGAIANSKQQVTTPQVTYLLGNAKLCRMDSDANTYLFKYVEEYRGVNFIKDTFLKIAYYYLLKNDHSKYAYYLTLVRNKGYLIDEKDKEALKEAQDSPPNIDLLRARLYYDGGYYDKAIKELKDKTLNDFKLPRDKIEFAYRLGRIYEKTEKLNEAITNYQKAIALGKTTSYYYAANAALAIGGIYEAEKDYNKAASYYNEALGMKNHEYQNSVDYDAKEGLARIHH